eukprot:5202207-Alexandrium_andersonii.AAC.1
MSESARSFSYPGHGPARPKLFVSLVDAVSEGARPEMGAPWARSSSTMAFKSAWLLSRTATNHWTRRLTTVNSVENLVAKP